MAPTQRYTHKADETDARGRLQAFWEGSSLGRPALQILAPEPDFDPKPWDYTSYVDRKALELTAEWQAVLAYNAVGGQVWLAEAMPGYATGIGGHIPLLATLLGGTYDYPRDDEGRHTWGPAWVETWEDVLDTPVPAFDPDHPVVAGLVGVIRGVAGALDGSAITSPPCWVDALTTLGNLRTEDALCMDLVTRADDVKAWCDGAVALCLKADQYFYDECVALGQGECISWLGLLSEGNMDAVHCDFSIMLSPEMFAEFVVPTLTRQAAHYGRTIYHLDGDANMRFLDQIAAVPGIDAMQYTRIAGSTYPGRCLDDYQTIRATGLSLYVNCDDVDDAVAVTRLLGPDGLYIVLPQFASVDEARRAIDTIAEACP